MQCSFLNGEIKMKKTLLAAALSAALLIASCGNGGNKASSASNDESADTAKVSVELAEISAEESCICDSCVCDSCACVELVAEITEVEEGEIAVAVDTLAVAE